MVEGSVLLCVNSLCALNDSPLAPSSVVEREIARCTNAGSSVLFRAIADFR